MVKATPLILAANAGEFSPRMDARVDFDKYLLGVSRALNLVVTPQGGMTLKPGNRFVKEIKDSTSTASLYGFEPVSGSAYMLEFGSVYMRFYQNQARLDTVSTSTVITNGTFTSNITNWTNSSTGTASISWSAGKMLLAGTGDGYAWAEQAIAVAGGDQAKLHVIQFTLSGNAGGKAAVQVGTVSLGSTLFKAYPLGIGQHTISFTPGAATVYFQVINKEGDNLYLDDVSVLSNVPLELASPYAAADVASLRITQSNDVFYIFHQSYAPRKLERRSNYSWSLTTAFFEDGPWGDINPDIDLDKANLVVNSAFDGGITGWTSSTHNGSVSFDGSQGVVFFYLQAHSSGQRAEIRQNISTISGSIVHVMHFQAVGKGVVTLKIGTTSGGSNIVSATTYDPGWYSISFTPGVTSFWISFGAYTGTNSSTLDVPGVGGVFIYTVRANLLSASATTGSVTITAAADFKPFVSSDVGRLIRIEHAGREPGWGVITGYTDSQHVTVLVYRKFASTVPCETWRMGAWSDTTGWPRTGIFFQQRLFGANTVYQPQTFWHSQSGDFQNMRPDSWVNAANTVEDDDAGAYTLGAKKGSPIQWFSGTRKLLIGTATGQWVASSKGAALTPTDMSVEPNTSVRGSVVDPIEINTVALFVERSKQAVDDIGYDYQIDGFRAADLTILADHIGIPGFEQLAYQSRPYSTLWARRTDGTLATLAYKREQNVVGWTPVQIAGSAAGAAVVESIAVIPGNTASGSQVYDSNNRDEVWMIVKRTIGGATKRYIEVMEGFFRGPNRAEYDTRASWLTAMLTNQADAFNVDCGITYSGGSTSTITGLSHLNGESVMVNGDGLAQGPFTVSGGQITLTTAVTKAQVGLSYSWRLRLLKMNYGAMSGTSVGQQKTVGTVGFVLLDSASFEYGVETTGEKGSDAVFYAASGHMPSGGALYTGEAVYPMTGGGYDTDPRIIMRGSQPLPWSFLGLMSKVVTNEQ